ncbi:MAG TPA: DCC1-like thiol-disulfide oxidoreductase family protein [Verrucomicrobiae bacterium]|nr:DCC1-like thiol-disulfide oxidoreductase family protein [Verrucomicrobiae bacterium]
MISLKDIVRAWSRFFFEPESPLPIALYRILLGLLVLANQALLYPDVLNWYGVHAAVSFQVAPDVSGGTGFNIFRWLPHTDRMVWLVYSLSCLSPVTLMLGLFSRVSAALVFLTLTTLHHRNPVMLNSGDTFLRIASFFVIFSQAGAALSIDRLVALARGKESGPPKPRAPWAMRLIQLQLAFLYLYAFIWKAMGPMWLAGTAVYYTSRLLEFRRFPVPYVYDHFWTIKLWSWGTLLVEFSLGVLVWIKELRYWVLLAGVLLHLGIDYSMNIPLFAFIMISAYVTFVEPADLRRFFSLVRQRFNREAKAESPMAFVPVFYDAKCSFCTRTVEVLRALDILRRLEFHPMQSPATKQRFPDFDPRRGEKEMLARSPDGWLGGFYAFRYMARSLPLLWPIVPLLYLPKIDLAGDRLYQRIAQRRYCILGQ